MSNDRSDVPAGTHWMPASFAESLRRAADAVLMLDYDGTLAPFRIRREEALPWPGILELLERIVEGARTRVVVISGRESGAVAHLLEPFRPHEIWGVHGLERRDRDGRLRRTQLPSEARDGLIEARRRLEAAGLASRLEEKYGALALHWRGLETARAEQLGGWAEDSLAPLAARHELEFRPFDGGVELRAGGPDKGSAVRAVLGSSSPAAVAAYLGDDLTDEDAFRALHDVMGGRGLGILVRSEPRASAADLRLDPPHELLEFLQHWVRIRGEAG